MYLTEDMFDVVAIAVNFDVVAEMFSAERSVETVGITDEKYGVCDIVFLGQPGEKLSCDRDFIRLKRPKMEYFVGFRINSGVQPVLFIVDADSRLIDSNAIRLSPPAGCKSAFCTQL